MSHIVDGDLDLHYSDNSHRYLCPYPNPTAAEEELWRARVDAHRDAHRRHEGEQAKRQVGKLWDELYASGQW